MKTFDYGNESTKKRHEIILALQCPLVFYHQALYSFVFFQLPEWDKNESSRYVPWKMLHFLVWHIQYILWFIVVL